MEMQQRRRYDAFISRPCCHLPRGTCVFATRMYEDEESARQSTHVLGLLDSGCRWVGITKLAHTSDGMIGSSCCTWCVPNVNPGNTAAVRRTSLPQQSQSLLHSLLCSLAMYKSHLLPGTYETGITTAADMTSTNRRFLVFACTAVPGIRRIPRQHVLPARKARRAHARRVELPSL